MRHVVTWNGKKLKVNLPDAIPDGVEFHVTIDERRYAATWHRSWSLLALRDDRGVERHLRVRGRETARYEGDVDTVVQAEIGDRALMHRLVATVGLDIPGQGSRETAKGDQLIRSQITGKVLKVMVKVGDKVALGQALLTVEAMKMENRVFAALPGKVLSVSVKEGEAVQTGKELVRIKP